MPVTDEQRDLILQLLSEGAAPNEIASRLGVSMRQIAAIRAHHTMGTYKLGSSRSPSDNEMFTEPLAATPGETDAGSVLIGTDISTGHNVFWNPAPTHSANPHFLIVGESGFGKTYALQCIITELAQCGIPSIVFDYGQGFATNSSPVEALSARSVETIDAVRGGVAINPLQIFPTDILGPIHVAQRVADTFCRVYPRLGVQQHALLRRAVLSTFEAFGFDIDQSATWSNEPPPFEELQRTLLALASDENATTRSVAAKVESHVSSIFFFKTFRASGAALRWDHLLAKRKSVTVLKLSGLESSLEKAVTEFLLWNLLGYLESQGPGRLRCFVVLDEAHRLPFDEKSPIDRLLREGRKFGIGLILASQQPSDFSEVAFSNTATKLVFQISDPKARIGQWIASKVANASGARQLSAMVNRLPRGRALFLTKNAP